MSTEPQPGLGSEAAHHAAYLDHVRETCIAKVASLPEERLSDSMVPSGSPEAAPASRRWVRSPTHAKDPSVLSPEEAPNGSCVVRSSACT